MLVRGDERLRSATYTQKCSKWASLPWLLSCLHSSRPRFRLGDRCILPCYCHRICTKILHSVAVSTTPAKHLAPLVQPVSTKMPTTRNVFLALSRLRLPKLVRLLASQSRQYPLHRSSARALPLLHPPHRPDSSPLLARRSCSMARSSPL